jgi:hypothetical protein
MMQIHYYHKASIGQSIIYGIVFFILMLPIRLFEIINRMNVENTWVKILYFVFLLLTAYVSVYVYRNKVRNGKISFYKAVYISTLTVFFGMLIDNLLMEIVTFATNTEHTFMLSAFSFLVVLFFGVLLGLIFGSFIAFFLTKK